MRKIVYFLMFFILGSSILHVEAQDTDQRPEQAVYEDPVTIFWLNTYGNLRVSDRIFWEAQTHFRFQESEETPFIGKMGQIYNRHALTYLFSKYFSTSLGGVLRINFNTNTPSSELESKNEQRIVPEWRIYHQYQFAQPLSRMMIYHRLRIEHRWTRSFKEDSEYSFRNRWRYMFTAKIPINKPYLGTETFYISPEVELIMQNGKSVIDSPMEDLRLHGSFGYIINPRLTVASGLMYSMGQELDNGAYYKQRWTLRFHVYFAPDLRKIKDKLPAIHMTD